MTTAIAKTHALPAPRPAAQRGSRLSWRPRFALAGLVITLAVVAVSASQLRSADWSTGTAGPEPALSSAPAGSPWLARRDVISLKKQLVRAGYSITVDGSVGPVTRSALADYLKPDATHPFSPFLASALRGTVVTGYRNPTAWNNYFGLDRRTRFVERPFTGPGGLLDPKGNLRMPAPSASASQARLKGTG